MAQSRYIVSMLLVGGLFFIFGFVTWLNSTLIPFLKLTCNLDSDAKSFFVTFAFYMAYFFLAIPSSNILQKTGLKNGMSLGLFVMSFGAIIFIPAAQVRSFELFLIGLFIQGMGLSLLQTASNPYVAILGPIESAAQRISIMGIFNKIAGMLAPLVFGFILLDKADDIEKSLLATQDAVAKIAILDTVANRIVTPYLILTIILVLLAIGIRYSSLPEISAEDNVTEGGNDKKSIWEYPHAIAGAFAIFFYVGVEVMAGDIIGTFGKNLGFSINESKYFTSFTLFAMLIGYVVNLILIPKFIKQEQWLNISVIIGIVLTIAAFVTSGMTAVYCVAALGFANAVMWPAIFPLGIDGLGRWTQFGSALLVMGIAGGAILPPLYGWLSEHLGFQLAFLSTILPCYLYIGWFALRGHRLGRH